MNKFFFIILLSSFLIVFQKVYSQSSYIMLGNPAYNTLERLEIKSGNLQDSLFFDIKPFERKNVATFVNSLDLINIKLTPSDQYWLNYIKDDNQPYLDSNFHSSKKPFLKHFYRSKANLYQYNSKDLNIFINPVLGWNAGIDQTDGMGIFAYRNTRGFEVRGNIDNRWGFYSYLTENQVVFPNYVKAYKSLFGYRDVFRPIPGQGLVKGFKNTPASDYFNARGYITFAASKHINLQFGNDQNFLGSGYRSLILSDFAKDYLFLKINTRIWRFHYQNLFTQFEYIPDRRLVPFPKKYGAFHYLSFNATKKLNIALMEGIIFYDNRQVGRGYDFSYLNPIIFYRSVEHGLGSPDNAVVGANVDWIPVKGFKLYGQVLFDEFLISHLRAFDNNIVNKYSLQGGFKWIDLLGIPNLDWQSEFNLIRPYTYSHDTMASSYSHFSQPLAHPMGANLMEFINIIRYNPYGPVVIQLKYVHLKQGRDTKVQENYGSNFLKSLSRTLPETAPLLQGTLFTDQYIEFRISSQVRHNLFIDVNASYFDEKSKNYSTQNIYATAGLRLNFAYPIYQY